jgi:hypothetical protein
MRAAHPAVAFDPDQGIAVVTIELPSISRCPHRGGRRVRRLIVTRFASPMARIGGR